MSLLDFKYTYSSSEPYRNIEEYSYHNVFEYDASIYTSTLNNVKNVDLLALFTGDERKNYIDWFY